MKTGLFLSLSVCMMITTVARADMLTTTFAGGNGQAGNMFDVVVLNANGITVEGFDVNLDPGTWDMEVWSRDSAYAGFEGSSAGWTLRDTITGLVSAGSGLATNWDFADFSMNGSATSSVYITVSNGPAINYTNGTAEGSVLAADANIQILEGTGNAFPFGIQFRPRNWNGTFYYSVNAIPEPSSMLLLGLAAFGFVSIRRRK